MQVDPYQLHEPSAPAPNPALLDSFEQRMRTLLACAGASCP